MARVVPARLSAAEQRSRAFQEWEVAGRGWTVWPYPVALEPELKPLPESDVEVFDDGRVKSLPELLLTPLVWGVRALWSLRDGTRESVPDEEVPALLDSEELVSLRLSCPADLLTRPETMQRLLLSLPNQHAPMSLEILGSADSLSISLVVRRPELRATKQQLAAYLPGVSVLEAPDDLALRWEALAEQGAGALDFALASEFMRPLACVRSFDPDPLVGLFAALADVDEGELVVLQVQFQRCSQDWRGAARAALTTRSEQPFFSDAPEMLPLAAEKFATPAFAVVLRLGLRASTEKRAWHLAQSVWRGLDGLTRADSNHLIPLDPGPYEEGQLVEDLLLRQSRRTGMLLSVAELASLVHLPGPSVMSEKLDRVSSRTRQAPRSCASGELLLGKNEHAGESHPVYLPDRLRSRHMHLLGASGTGKSTLILQMALQDLEAGRGLAVIDPHGDLIDDLLARMPAKRHQDLVLVDPSDPEYSVGFNVLSASTDLEKQLLSSDLVASFKRLSTSWGDQMTSVLGNAILAFLEHPAGGSLADLRRFLVEKEFRARFLAQVEDEEVRYFWEKEFPLLSGRPQAPLLTRLDSFLRHRLVRQMVAQKKSSFDLRSVMDGQGVLLVRLAQGAIGEENAALLGALFVSRLQQAAQSRQELAERERRPFTLYLDEFHNYLTPSMAGILSGGRKYGLGLVLAHQDLSQLGRREGGVLGAAIANPATRICFRLGDSDARKLADGFTHFSADDLQSLGVGQAVCRVEQASQDFNLQTDALPPLGEDEADRARANATDASRRAHSRPRLEIDEELAAARGSGSRPQTPRPVAEDAPVAAEEKSAPASAPVQAPASTSEKSTSGAPLPVPAPKEQGRGGDLHRYWQRLVRDTAKRHGWKARIESKLPGGGLVDVLIEQGGRRIGVEVSISTDGEHEMGNLRKCVEAGLDLTLGLYAESATLRSVRRSVQQEWGEAKDDRLLLGTPEEVLAKLGQVLGSSGSAAERMHGFVVRVETEVQPLLGQDKDVLARLIKRLWREGAGE